MTKLNDIFDLLLLEEMIEQRYVTRRFHDTYPMAILNYTDKAVYDSVWNEVTLACRGLIYYTDTFTVSARPFPKFFNMDQPQAATINPALPVEVTDKMDGSLGILFPHPAGWSIATRGSFHSDQAEWATKWWNENYGTRITVNDEYTFLFEIIAPWNRIVLDYGDRSELVLLGCVDSRGNVHGPDFARESFGYFEKWPGSVTEVMPFKTIEEMLAAPDRPNAEGYVIRQGNAMIKVKQADYINLHRLISNLSERSVWEALSAGKTPVDICEDLPDEFQGFVKETSAKLIAEFDAVEAGAEEAFLEIQAKKPVDRREFAMLASKSTYRPYLFSILDGKPIQQAIWKQIKPKNDPIVKVDDE